jgi:hypothetical protein
MVVRAGARPVAGVHDVHRALRAGDEEAGTAVANPNPDHTLPAASEMGDDDAFGAGDARGERGTGGAHPGELLLDTLRDGLDYTDGAHRTSLVFVGRAPGGGNLCGAISLSDIQSIQYRVVFVYISW